MSHPAASIKSIFSGKVNLDTPDDLDPFEYANSANNTSFDTYDDSEDINVGDGVSEPHQQQSFIPAPIGNSTDHMIYTTDHNSTTINKSNPRSNHHHHHHQHHQHQHQFDQLDSDNNFNMRQDPKYDNDNDDIDDDNDDDDDDDDGGLSRLSRDDSNYSITSKNLRTLSESFAPEDGYQGPENEETNKHVRKIGSGSSPQNLAKAFPHLKSSGSNFIRNNDANVSSTNISLASTGSDYQREYTDENEDYLMTHASNANTNEGGVGGDNRNNNFMKSKEVDDILFASPPPSDYLQTNDPFTRSLSRNSTTSCLSTTATKDGIEGKRLHRHGPTTYSSNIISNMIHSQQQQQQQQQQQRLAQLSSAVPTSSDSAGSATTTTATASRQYKSPLSSVSTSNSIPQQVSLSSPPQTPMQNSTTDSILHDNDPSEYSILTTQAELDGEHGLGGERSQRYFENNLPNDYKLPPPVTLTEKINLINTDSITFKK